jgi:hypothetical protein
MIPPPSTVEQLICEINAEHKDIIQFVREANDSIGPVLKRNTDYNSPVQKLNDALRSENEIRIALWETAAKRICQRVQKEAEEKFGFPITINHEEVAAKAGFNPGESRRRAIYNDDLQLPPLENLWNVLKSTLDPESKEKEETDALKTFGRTFLWDYQKKTYKIVWNKGDLVFELPGYFTEKNFSGKTHIGYSSSIHVNNNLRVLGKALRVVGEHHVAESFESINAHTHEQLTEIASRSVIEIEGNCSMTLFLKKCEIRIPSPIAKKLVARLPDQD